MKFLHTGDLHLVAGEWPSIEDRVDVCAKIGALAQEHQVDAILVAGDVYERLSDVDARHAALEVFKCWAATAPVLIVEGNHDVPGDLEWLSSIHAQHPIIVARGPMRVGIKDCDVHMLPWPRREAFVQGAQSVEEVREALTAAVRRELALISTMTSVPGRGHVILAHAELTDAMLDGGQPAAGRCEVPLTAQDFLDSGAHYVALGHIHAEQVFDGGVRYAGSPYPTKFGSDANHGCTVVYVSTDGLVHGEKFSLEGPRMVTLAASPGFLEDHRLRDIDYVRIIYRAKHEEREIAMRESAELKFNLERHVRGVKVDMRIEAPITVRDARVVSASTLQEKLYAYLEGNPLRKSVLERYKTVEVEL